MASNFLFWYLLTLSTIIGSIWVVGLINRQESEMNEMEDDVKCNFSEAVDMLERRIRSGAEFPDAAYGISVLTGWSQKRLERAYDDRCGGVK